MLHLKQRPNGSYDKPQAFFSLSPNERDGFYDFLKLVKYLDCYAANISRSMNAKNGRLSGLKATTVICYYNEFFQLGCEGLHTKTLILYCLNWTASLKTYAQRP